MVRFIPRSEENDLIALDFPFLHTLLCAPSPWLDCFIVLLLHFKFYLLSRPVLVTLIHIHPFIHMPKHSSNFNVASFHMSLQSHHRNSAILPHPSPCNHLFLSRYRSPSPPPPSLPINQPSPGAAVRPPPSFLPSPSANNTTSSSTQAPSSGRCGV